MRMDYALYGLAIVLFTLTAITIVMVPDSEAKLLYATSTAVVGLLSVGAGYLLRPKTSVVAAAQTAIPEPPTPQTPEELNRQAGGPIVEAPTTQIQSSEALKVETLAVQAPIIAETQPETQVKAPLQTKSPPIEVVASTQQIETAPLAASAGKTSDFSTIRSISQKRAEQLKSVGINTMNDLAKASATDLAEKLNVSIKIVKMWIGMAKKLK